ncbi:MAG: aldehyde dehydrogenase [Pseudomonadota bacterium]
MFWKKKEKPAAVGEANTADIKPKQAPRSHREEKLSLYNVALRIGGADAASSAGKTVIRTGPVTGDPVTTVEAASASDVNAAIEAAANAYKSWSQTGPNHRREILLKAADIIQSKAAQFSAIVMAETGATKMWGGFNAKLGAEIMREAAAMTTRLLGETIPADRPGTLSLAIRKPVGVMVGIAPWNAPVILGVRAVAMPIACGNTVVMKASEACPMTHRLIVDCLIEAGLPEGVCNFISHDPADAPEIVEALVTHPDVKRINFTGSTKVGKIIAAHAAKDLKPVLLELGGKAPFIVLDDANLDEAVRAAAFGAFMNQGQICMSTERIIVADSVADAFVEKLQAKVASFKSGNPAEDGVQIGGVVDVRTIAHVESLVADAEQHGANIVLKGTADGAIMSPNLVDKVTQDMRLWSEESFGPIVCVARATSDAHAVELANDTEYGLSAAVFGSDISRAMEVANAIESGICHINGPTVFDEAQMPFGGVKASGYGRFGGTFGVDQFTEVKWMTINSKPLKYPL